MVEGHLPVPVPEVGVSGGTVPPHLKLAGMQLLPAVAVAVAVVGDYSLLQAGKSCLVVVFAG